ncbi:Hypothetical predicted protein [Olea europaea subsp. europaea]|uniref:Uncharacterized protein n=1 Tax=Olea europaea subsp. europaea TaxID=158383 RepID=A0A8S0TEU3_OLEEU|nr:Hypothetical predicted protein [Olea europaea subsp. europaea]
MGLEVEGVRFCSKTSSAESSNPFSGKMTHLVDERRAPPDSRRQAEHSGAARVTHALAVEATRETTRKGHRRHVWKIQPEVKKEKLFLDEFLTFWWCWISVWYTMEADTVSDRKVEMGKLFHWRFGDVSWSFNSFWMT